MSNPVISFLERAGKAVAHGVVFFLTKILPVTAKDAQLAAPLIALALPAEGPIFATVVNAVLATESAYASLGKQAGTGQEKLAAVLTAVQTQLLPELQKAGLTGQAAIDAITKYVNAIVGILNGPAVELPPAK
jgi:hypothetical protein